VPLDDLPATYCTAWGITNLGQHVAVVVVMVLYLVSITSIVSTLVEKGSRSQTGKLLEIVEAGSGR
jgi:hypothetical protein